MNETGALPGAALETPRLTTPGAARILGVSATTLARAIESGRPAPAHYVIGGRRRFARAEVLAFLAARRVPAVNGTEEAAG